MIRRILATVAIAAIACGVAACNLDFGPFHRTSTVCFIFCPYWRLEPSSAGVLRGDTLRMSACWEAYCGFSTVFFLNARGSKGSDTGDVPSKWQLSSGSEFIVLNDGLASVASATSVLVHALAPGRATVSVVSPTHGTAFASVRVADSSVISSIEIRRIGSGGETVNTFNVSAGKPDTAKFDVILSDSSGATYSAWPTAWTVSDTTVLRVVRVAPSWTLAGAARLEVVGYKYATAVLRVHFLSVTRELSLTVVQP